MGATQRIPKKNLWYLKPPGMADKGHHITQIKFSPEVMSYEVIMLDRSVRDQYTFKPRPVE